MKFSNTIPVVRAQRGHVFIDFMCDDGLGNIPVASIALTRHAATALAGRVMNSLEELNEEESASVQTFTGKDRP